ncbi:MAG: hypothetical protein ABEH40_02970 [Haloferacaceae archaeon]
MQRRAAAIYAVVFVLIGTASYTLIATAERPHVSLESPEHELSQGDTARIDGRTYTVSSITAESSGGGGGHGGGGGGVTRAGELTWTNQSARYTRSWEGGATVTLDGEEYVVRIPNASDPASFALERAQNRTAILRADPAADNETVTRDGEEFVVVTENGTSRLVPAEEYFPAPERTRYREGDEVQYRGNATTVASVTDASVTLAWTAPRTNAVELTNEANVTLGGQQYFVYFPDNSTVLLESDYSAYARDVAEIDRFTEHRNGLWGVTTLSGAAAVLLVGMAFLPSRY